MGVKDFNGAGAGKGLLFITVVHTAAFENEKRTQPFAAGENGVAHRPVQHRRHLVFARQPPIQRRLDGSATFV